MFSCSLDKKNLYKHFLSAFLCFGLFLGFVQVKTFADPITGSSPGCFSAMELNGEYVSSNTCTSVPGNNLCPTNDFVCCPTTFTTEAANAVYSTIDETNGVCTNGNVVHTQDVGTDEFAQWGWLEVVNGNWFVGYWNTAVSPCSDGQGTAVGGGPNYNSLCEAGYRMYARGEGFTDSFEFYCAYGKEITVDGGTLPACTALIGAACNNTPIPSSGNAGTLACADTVLGTAPGVECRYTPSGGDTGTCSYCAGNEDPTTMQWAPGLPRACSPDGKVSCCNVGADPITQCMPIFNPLATPVNLPGNLGSTLYGCFAPPNENPANTNMCGPQGGTDAYCVDGNQCATGICAFKTPTSLVKTCRPKPLGGSCDPIGAEGDCYCDTAAGQTCKEDPDSPGEGVCSIECLAPTEQCIIGISCCDNVGGIIHNCQPPVPPAPPGPATCTSTGNACIIGTGACTDGTSVPPDVCCEENHTCQPNLSTPQPTDWLCLPPPPCNAVSGVTACPNGVSDCCPTTNPGWGCELGVCTDNPTQGFACTGTACCAGSAGLVCQNGNCVPSEACDATIDPNPYTGPIVVFDDLLARIYAILYPLGIFLGTVIIGKAGYTLMTSEGNPAKVKEGQEELTAAILGVMFILLSIVIMRVIIKSILGITI